MIPTWYDLLGVEPDASPEEIRAAWKSGIADLDPGDRRFRSLNQAAEVLLDPDRRAAYDATLAPEPETEPETGPETGPEPAREPSTVVEVRGAPATSLETPAADAPEPARTRGTIPAWLLGGLATVVALLVASAGYLLTQPADAAVEDSTRQAQSAAERAATTILAYDFRHLEEDQQAAGALMTPAYREKYDALFAQIAANAPELQVVVTVEVVASGIVRSGQDRVQVLVFVNRPTLRKDATEPEIFRDQVVLTMVRSDEEWLVDDMETNQLAG